MSDNRKDLPPANSPQFLMKVSEAVQTYLGFRGDKLDRGLTVRDLTDANIIALNKGFLRATGNGVRPVAGPGTAVVDEVDLTPPPTPTGFIASAAISNIILECDPPLYRQGHGHNKTIVYGAKRATGAAAPVFATAIPITEFTGIVASYSTDPATTWHLWAKWQTVDGVQSVTPAGGTNGVVVTTGQDVGLLLEALTSQITADQLYIDLGSRINLIDGPESLPGSVNARFSAASLVAASANAAEAASRIEALALETAARNADIAAEALTRANADTAEADARQDAVTVESIRRREQVSATAEALLRNTLAYNDIRLETSGSLAIAKEELTSNLNAGILAEAASRLTLAAKLDTEKATTLALISDESTARSNAISAEAQSRNLLATQFRGAYTGNDPALLTEGLLYQERVTRAAQDSALSQQITLLSAGAGEQFDWQTIWYFDTDAEGWTGNGTPTVAEGFLRPANQATGAYVQSPANLTVEGPKYQQTRLRVRKVGEPVWLGYLYWQSTTDNSWDALRRAALTVPTWDANGIGLVTVSQAWAGTIKRIRIDLSSAQTSTDYYELDWVAVGRPSPGASSAQLLVEQTARIDGDTALTNSVTTLSAQVNNATTGLPAAHAGIVVEQIARASAMTAEAAARTTLAARVTTTEGRITTNESAISTQQATFATANATNASNIDALASQVNNAATGLPKTRSDLIEARDTFANDTKTFSTDVRTLKSQSEQLGEAALRAILSGEAVNTSSKNNIALASQELRTEIIEGLSSEAAARLALVSIVNTNAALLTSEQITRANADSAESASRIALTARVATGETNIAANAVAISSEQSARATADEALGSRVDALIATTNTDRTNVQAAITSEVIARTSVDQAEASARATLTARVAAAENATMANTATIADESITRANADSANASRSTALESLVNNGVTGLAATRATLLNDYRTRADTDGAIAQSSSFLRAYTDSSVGSVDARVNNIESSKIGYCTIGGVASDQTNRASCESAGGVWSVGIPLSTAVKQVSVTSGGVTSSLEQKFTAQASANNTLYAQYTIKIDNAGLISGYGLASSANNATPSSAFGVRANQFYIAAPSVAQPTEPTSNLYDGYVWLDTSISPNVTRYRSGSSWVLNSPALPFTVQTTPITINGVLVPAGVYMSDSYIQNGTITNAKIGNAAIDDAKIASLSAVKITSGSITVGTFISSSSYIPNTQGWAINGSGGSEFSNTVVRGGIYAGYGTIGGNTIDGTGIQSNNYNGYSGWRIDSVGDAYFGNVSIRGQINTGSYLGYAWPPSGGGSHLSNNGLLLGNPNTGGYFQVTAEGSVYSPNLSMSNGAATFSGSLSTSSGLFTVDAAGRLTAIEADIQRRIVLQTGVFSPGGPVTDPSGAYDGYPGKVVFQVPPLTLIATDIYDSYLVNNSACQQFGVSLHAESSTNYFFGSGNFQFAATGETLVNRTYSVGGVNTANDTRVYISVTKLICTFLSNAGGVYWPTFRWKLYKL